MSPLSSIQQNSLSFHENLYAKTTLDGIAKRVKEAFAERTYIGPSLRFEGQSYGLWKVSMMLTLQPKDDNPPLVLIKKAGAYVEVKPTLIDSWGQYRFYRYNFWTIQGALGERVKYKIGNHRYVFNVPSISKTANMLVSSCNGVQTIKDEEKFSQRGGLLRMWNAAMELHKEEPFNINAMNGDQIYMDGLEEILDENTNEEVVLPTGVFGIPSVKSWLALERGERNRASFTEEMHHELTQFYFYKYLLHFFDNGAFSKALSSIPAMMLSGDHDFYDGIGSYPDDWSQSPVLQGIYEVGLRTYMLFQHHTSNSDDLLERGFLSEQDFSFLRIIDNGELALLGIDTRSQRTRNQIVRPDTYHRIFQSLENLPKNCKFLVVMLEIPIIYPSLKVMGKVLESVEGEGVIQKLERILLKQIPGFMSEFGDTCELTDDIDDQWSAERHQEERRLLITKLKTLSDRSNLEIIFVGGDAHLATTGIVGKKNTSPSMYQCVTSAIVNTPPSELADLLSLYMKVMNEEIAPKMNASMIHIQKEGSEKQKILFSKRNFAVLKNEGNHLFWRLHVEPKNGERITNLSVYSLVIPYMNKKKNTSEISDSSEASHVNIAPLCHSVPWESETGREAQSLSKKRCCVLL